MRIDNDWMCLNSLLCEFSWFTTTFSRTLERNLRLDTGQYFFVLSSSRMGFCNRGEATAALEVWGGGGKEPSASDKLIIDVIDVTRHWV